MRNPMSRSALAMLAVAMLFAGCGGGGSGSGGSSNGSSTGTLVLGLTDASTVDYRAVYVTIEEIRVHQETGDRWHVVGRPERTYNLLDLVNGVRAPLGLAELIAGRYTQMRLVLGLTPDGGLNLLNRKHPHANYVIDCVDQVHELKVPSGLRSGIKLVRGFEIVANGTTDLILDFDAERSVVKAGNSGKWLLKPTIKVLDTREASVITGRVTPVDPEGVVITAQKRDPGAADPKDRVTVVASTVTDENGRYALFLPPDVHVLVAYRDGYEPACAIVDSATNSRYEQDFVLQPARTGSVVGSVLVPGAEPEVHVTLSVRGRAECPGQSERVEIELKSTNVANAGRYELRLPAGTFGIVASTGGKASLVKPVTITPGREERLDIRF